jgi:hypothetical protein
MKYHPIFLIVLFTFASSFVMCMEKELATHTQILGALKALRKNLNGRTLGAVAKSDEFNKAHLLISQNPNTCHRLTSEFCSLLHSSLEVVQNKQHPVEKVTQLNKLAEQTNFLHTSILIERKIKPYEKLIKQKEKAMKQVTNSRRALAHVSTEQKLLRHQPIDSCTWMGVSAHDPERIEQKIIDLRLDLASKSELVKRLGKELTLAKNLQIELDTIGTAVLYLSEIQEKEAKNIYKKLQATVDSENEKVYELGPLDLDEYSRLTTNLEEDAQTIKRKLDCFGAPSSWINRSLCCLSGVYLCCAEMIEDFPNWCN